MISILNNIDPQTNDASVDSIDTENSNRLTVKTSEKGEKSENRLHAEIIKMEEMEFEIA